jgi:hypothetical protein
MQPSPYGSVPPYGGLRPLAVGEIIDRAIQVYRKNFVALVTMTAVTIIPISILTVLVQLSARSSRHETTTTIGGINFSSSSGDTRDAWVGLAATVAILFLTLVAGRLAIGTCTRGVTDAYLGGIKADARSSLSVFAQSFGSLLWIEMLAIPAVLVGWLFCFVPGIWLWIAWLVTAPVMLIEGARGLDALRRSFRLVRPRWWPAFGLSIVVVLLTLVVRFSFSLLLVGVILTHHSATSTGSIVASGAIGALASLVTMPLIATVYVILYFDLRVRSEGLDLQLAIEGLDGAATPAVAHTSGPPTGAPQFPPPPPPPPPPFAPPPPAPR